MEGSMSVTQHICRNRPAYKGSANSADPWVDGSVNQCPFHGPHNRNAKRVRWGKKARAKMDRETGSLGTDHGSHIRGN